MIWVYMRDWFDIFVKFFLFLGLLDILNIIVVVINVMSWEMLLIVVLWSVYLSFILKGVDDIYYGILYFFKNKEG